MRKIFSLFAALAMVMSMTAETWTVAGSPASVFGTAWDPANTANVMADQGDGNYKWEKSDLTLAASTIEFKVVKGNAWGEEYPGANYQLKINESGVYTITITFNEGSHEVNAVATKQGAAEVIPTIAIAGDMNGWNTTANEFVIADDKKTASLTLALEAKDYGFKMIVAGSWTSDGNVVTRENNTTVFTGANSDANCTLTADVAGDYTFTWTYATNTLEVAYPNAGENPGDTTVTPEPTLGLTYNVTVPEGTNACYIAGDMNTWTFTEMTKVDDTHYTITIAEATLEMGYKYCSGPDWAYVEKSTEGEELQNRVYSENDVVAAWAAVYDPNGGENPEPNPQGAYYVTGNAELVGEKAWIADAIAMTENEGVYTHTFAGLTTGVTYQLKVTNGTWEQNWGYEAVLDAPAAVTGDTDGNVVFEVAEAGDVVVTFNGTNITLAGNFGQSEDTTVTPEPTLGLTYNVTVPEGTNACYIAGDMNTWTFTEMTKVDDTHYTITIAEATLEMGYKYCSGPDWAYVEKSAEGEELQNRVYSENDVVAAWAAVYDPNGGENPEPNPQGAYYVTGNAELVGEKAWIADAIAMTENEGVYTHTFVGLTTGVTYQLKVTNGTWEQNWGYDAVLDAPAAVTGDADGNVVFEVAEVGDVIVTFNGTNITLAGNFGQSEDTTVTPEPTLGLTYNVTVPEGTNACYIAGDMNTWTFTEMTKVDDTHYTITIAEATLEMGYKYCSGPDWAYVEKSAEGEELQNRVYSENDVVAAWAAIYDPNGGENPEPNPQGAYYVTGNAELVGEKAWIADAIAMTENEGVYTHTFAGLTTGVTYQLKVTNGTWEQNWGYEAVLDAPAAVTGDADGNVVFEVAEAGDVVVTFNGTNITLAGNFGQSEDTTVTPEPTLGLTYNVTVPEGTNACYIAGDMNTWTFTEMTKVDDTHYTITIDEATLEMGYKYCSGPDWAYVEKSAEGEELQNRVYSENDVVAAWAAIYDPNGGENPEPNPGTSTVMLAGEMNDWSTDATPFVAAEDGLTASVTVVLEAQTYQFKVVVDGDWLSNLGEMTRDNCTGWTFESLSGAETNARITADVAGEYTFVWSYADSKLSVVYPDNTTTDLDQVIGSAQPTKVICNGQLMIIRDGMIYTIMGQLIK